jgi:ADP-ribosylglycohydrolase
MTEFRSYYPASLEVSMLIKAGRVITQWRSETASNPTAIPVDIDVADKIDGMILGLAIGDALGNTSEALNPQERRSQFGWIDSYLPNSHFGNLRLGLPSDDTQLAAWTIEQILDEGRLEPQLLGYRFSADRICGAGSTVREFLKKFKSGVSWVGSGPVSAGNGALMRIAPVIIPYVRDPSIEMWADTLMAAHLTHNDDLSNSSCLAFVNILWLLVSRNSAPAKNWWINEWASTAAQVSTGQRYAARNGHPSGFEGTIPELLEQYVVPALGQDLPVDVACGIWHSGAYLLETVPSVLYILSRHGHDPRQAILEAVNNTRDNDTIAAIVGAAVGALHGASALPQEWIDGLLGRTRADDDHHLFQLLGRCAWRFGYVPREQTQSRAKSARSDRQPDGALDEGLVAGQHIDLGPDGYWIHLVSYLVHTWSVIHHDPVKGNYRAWFFDDGAHVFDFIDFESMEMARTALRSNQYSLLNPDDRQFVSSDIAADVDHNFVWMPHRIYSSGLYWLKG